MHWSDVLRIEEAREPLHDLAQRIEKILRQAEADSPENAYYLLRGFLEAIHRTLAKPEE